MHVDQHPADTDRVRRVEYAANRILKQSTTQTASLIRASNGEARQNGDRNRPGACCVTIAPAASA